MAKKFILNKQWIGVLTLILLLVVLSMASKKSQNSSSSGDLLVKISTQGGLCVYGECWRETEIAKDGNFKWVEGSKETGTGSFTSGQMLKLVEEIQNADFKKIMSVPFDDICPTAWDGTESTYIFYQKWKSFTFSNCEVKVDYDQSLFKTLETMLKDIF